MSRKKGWTRLADWCWAEYQRGPEKISLYCLRHLPFHLHKANRDKNARTVLLDFDFLQAKLEFTDAGALIADYDYLPKEADLRLVQSAIRLSAHVLARHHRQMATCNCSIGFLNQDKRADSATHDVLFARRNLKWLPEIERFAHGDASTT